MAMTKCGECKNPVSTKAEVCLNCGAPIIKKTNKTHLIGKAFAASIVLILVFASMDNKETKEPAQEHQIVEQKTKAKPKNDVHNQWNWESVKDELEDIKRTVKKIEPDPKKNGLSIIETKKLKSLKKIVDNLINEKKILKIIDNDTAVRIHLNPTSWKNTPYQEKITFSKGFIKYINLIHLSKNLPGVTSIYLVDGLTNNRLGKYSTVNGAYFE